MCIRRRNTSSESEMWKNLLFWDKSRSGSTGTSPEFRFGTWWPGLSSSLHCPPWLWTSSKHSWVLGASIWTMHSHSELLKVSLIMFYLNMVDCSVFFPSLSTLTWDTFLTLRGTFRAYIWSWWTTLLPFTGHLGLGHPSDTLGYFGHLSEPYTPTIRPSTNFGLTAKGPIPFTLSLIWLWRFDLGLDQAACGRPVASESV